MPANLRGSFSFAYTDEKTGLTIPQQSISFGFSCREVAADDFSLTIRSSLQEKNLTLYDVGQELFNLGIFEMTTGLFYFSPSERVILEGWIQQIAAVYPNAAVHIQDNSPPSIIPSVSRAYRTTNPENPKSPLSITIRGNGQVIPAWWWVVGIARAYDAVLRQVNSPDPKADMSKVIGNTNVFEVISESAYLYDAWYNSPNDARMFLETLGAVLLDGDKGAVDYLDGYGPVSIAHGHPVTDDDDDRDDSDED